MKVKVQTIDKLYVARYNFENGAKVEFDHSKSHAENSREANENLLLDMYIKILTDENNVDETKAPLDNTIEIVKGKILPIVRGENQDGVNYPFKYLSPTYQLDKKFEYNGGKNGISPFALNNAIHPIAQLIGLRFKESTTLNGFGFGRLDNVTDNPATVMERDKYGKMLKNAKSILEVPTRVLDWLSTMISSHVDVAKDPYVIALGVNQWTYNMANFLIRSGAGESSFYFLAQPILKEMSLAAQKVQGKYGVNTKKSNYTLLKEELGKIVTFYKEQAYAAAETDVQRYDVLDLFKSLESDKNPNPLTMSRDYLIDLLREHNLTKDAGKKPSYDFLYKQLEVYKTFLQLSPYAKEMSDLIQLSQVDTKKFGNSFILHRQFLYRVKNFIMNAEHFDSADLIGYFKDTFLDTKIRNSMILGRNLFSGQFLTTTAKFDHVFDCMLSWLGKYQRATKDEVILKLISNEMEASIKGDFFEKFMLENNLDVRTMLYGENSMARRLDRLKTDILTGKYPEMLTTDGRIKNELLNHITTEYKALNEVYNAPDVIVTPALRSNDKYLERRLIKYWEELYDSPHEEIAKFAKDLVAYAFTASGDNFNRNAIFHLVSNRIREDIGYVAAIRGATEEMENGSYMMDVDNIYLNTWYNDNLVPYLERLGGTPKKLMSSAPINGIVYPVVMTIVSAEPIGFSREAEPIYPRYIKHNFKGDNNPESTIIYRYVGHTMLKTGENAPVYMAVNKKGMYLNGKVVREYNSSIESALPFNNIPYSADYDYASLFKTDENDKYVNVNIQPGQIASWKNVMKNLKTINDFRIHDHEADLTYEQIMDFDILAMDVVPGYGTKATTPETTSMTSGGADGADTYFHRNAEAYGMTDIKHYRGPGVTQLDSPSLRDRVKPTTVSAEMMAAGEKALSIAVLQMGRKISKTDRGKELTVRNYAQVVEADAVFAVSYLESGSDSMVEGGTGYAVQYAKNLNKPLYLFDMNQNKWLGFNYKLNKFVEITPPRLTKRFAGVGSRRMTESGVAAIKDLFERTFGASSMEKTPVNPTISAEVTTIYNNLGDRTKSENVEIKSVYRQAGVAYAKSIGGVFSMRTDSAHHFGNPFTSNPETAKKEGLIKTNSTRESVERYIDWVLNSMDDRAEWIRSTIASGVLKGKPIVYYTELNEPSHATALDYLINQYEWGTVETEESAKPSEEPELSKEEKAARDLASITELAIAHRESEIQRLQSHLNEILDDTSDIDKQAVQKQFDEIVEKYPSTTETDKLRESLLRLLCNL